MKKALIFWFTGLSGSGKTTIGLYVKARSGAIDNLIGYSPGTVYEPPQTPDLIIDSGSDSAEGSIKKFYQLVSTKLGKRHAI